MPRKDWAKHDHTLDNGVIDAFQMTTREERKRIALHWCQGNYSAAQEYAMRDLLPIAVVVAALIDIDHPLLVSPGRGVMFSMLECALKVFAIEIHGTVVDIPIFYEVPHRGPVYSENKAVDKSPVVHMYTGPDASPGKVYTDDDEFEKTVPS